MEVIPASSTFLMQNFQEFYREVLIQKEKAIRTVNARQSPLDQEGQHVHFEQVVDNIQAKFRQMFERFSLNAQTQVGEFALSHFQESLYIMVSLVDEVFLSFPWPGQKRWEDYLIEAQLFHTQIAGELFYKKLDALIETNDPVRNDLAVLYLMALSLGFKGQYRGEQETSKICWYRHQLYVRINRQDTNLYHPGREQLIPPLYTHTLEMPMNKGLPDLRTWFIAFGSILLIYLLISSFAWYHVVRDLDGVIGHIISQGQKLGVS